MCRLVRGRDTSSLQTLAIMTDSHVVSAPDKAIPHAVTSLTKACEYPIPPAAAIIGSGKNSQMTDTMRLRLGLYAVLASSLCAPPATAITGRDLRPTLTLKCTGAVGDDQDCIVQAKQLCPNGYSVIDDGMTIKGTMVARRAVIVRARDHLTVSCK